MQLDALPLVHDADGVVVIDKPAGLPSTGHTLDDPRCAQHRLATQLRRRVWAVHQLDAATSGLLVFVRKRSLVAPWSAKLKAGTKTYVAVVHGKAPRDTTVDAPLGWIAHRRRRGVTSSGQAAVTRVHRCATTGEFSWVQAVIETGRTHQVRLHLEARGHPLVGEQRYRDPACALHPRHALHAWRLDLPGMPSLVAPVPADLQELARRLGLPPEPRADWTGPRRPPS